MICQKLLSWKHKNIHFSQKKKKKKKKNLWHFMHEMPNSIFLIVVCWVSSSMLIVNYKYSCALGTVYFIFFRGAASMWLSCLAALKIWKTELFILRIGRPFSEMHRGVLELLQMHQNILLNPANMTRCVPRHTKTYLRAYAGSEGPDQTAYLRSLIWAFVVR